MDQAWISGCNNVNQLIFSQPICPAKASGSRAKQKRSASFFLFFAWGLAN
jgi:hypothetical protein